MQLRIAEILDIAIRIVDGLGIAIPIVFLFQFCLHIELHIIGDVFCLRHCCKGRYSEEFDTSLESAKIEYSTPWERRFRPDIRKQKRGKGIDE